ncbi:MAG: DUF1850 domain-containing protein [Deltaproteobacteria bacterium]|nr:DUF1850 domain-containing protein [Deltaproteobacteria bacterium]
MAVFIPVLIALALLGGWLMGSEQRLEVKKDGTPAPLLHLEVKPGAYFSVWFFHSYDRSYFEEHYCLTEKGTLLLSHMSFKSSLNGQGFEFGTYRCRPDGSAELADINKELDEVIFRLGSPDLANHTLIIDGQRLSLLDYAEPGDLMNLSVVSQPRWKHIWSKCFFPRRGRRG